MCGEAPSVAKAELSARARNGVQSIEVGADLLRALAAADEPQPLSSLARAAGMSSGKAHRYLVSYVQSGLVVQSERSGSYDLGPLAMRIGLAALRRYDAVRSASARLGELRDEINETVTLTVWADGGPTIARIELSGHPVTLAVRVGTAFPLLNTATGRIFLAFGEPREIGKLIDDELAALRSVSLPGIPHTRAETEAIAEDVRRRGLARVDQSFLIGINAIAAPIFAGDGRLAAVVTVLGRSQQLDVGWESPVAKAITAFTAACSDEPSP
ncbi:MAG: IclR family transcriptional regulator [Candidatus Velthaea sp.]